MDSSQTEIVGRRAMVWTSDSSFEVASAVIAGVVEAADESFLFLHKPDGETLCIPRGQITRIQFIETPQTDPAQFLLRASKEPSQADSLLRPAQGVADADPQKLLRASEPPDEKKR